MSVSLENESEAVAPVTKVTGKIEANTHSLEMSQISDPLATTSSKIRALNAAGYSRMSISVHLNKRYQHVRNVLETKLTSK